MIGRRFFAGVAVVVGCLASAVPVAPASASSSSEGVAPRGLGWSMGALIPKSGSLATSVSCPTRSFCMVVGGKSAFLWQSGTWTVFHDVETQGWGELKSVSCPSTTFCAAVDATGYEISFDGQSWSKPASIDPSTDLMDSVSCASSGLCVAVDAYGKAVVDRGGVWSTPRVLDPPNGVTGGFGRISCATTTFCMATDQAGYAREFNGTRWLPIQKLVVWFGTSSISCPTPRFCLATDTGYNAEYVLWNGKAWSMAVEFPGTPLTGPQVSCPSPAFCMVMDYDQYTLRLVHGKWTSGPQGYPTDPLSLSCPMPRFCMALGVGGIYSVYGPMPPGVPKQAVQLGRLQTTG